MGQIFHHHPALRHMRQHAAGLLNNHHRTALLKGDGLKDYSGLKNGTDEETYNGWENGTDFWFILV